MNFFRHCENFAMFEAQLDDDAVPIWFGKRRLFAGMVYRCQCIDEDALRLNILHVSLGLTRTCTATRHANSLSKQSDVRISTTLIP